jgi:hypothetical protein
MEIRSDFPELHVYRRTDGAVKKIENAPRKAFSRKKIG